MTEIKLSNYYVTYEQVLYVLLDRYSITDISLIGISSPLTIPILNWLHAIQHKITSFLSIYFSTTFSSICTLADLDRELYNFLKSFGFPCLSSYIDDEKQEINLEHKMADSNQIDIDERENNESKNNINQTDDNVMKNNTYEARLTNDSFQWFGLGKVSSHPFVISNFQLNNHSKFDLATTSECTITSSDILSHFIEFTSSSGSNSNRSTRFRKDDFASYLLYAYQKLHLSEIGVYLKGDFKNERIALSHIINNHQSRLLALQKKELLHHNNHNNYDSRSTCRTSNDGVYVEESSNDSYNNNDDKDDVNDNNQSSRNIVKRRRKVTRTSYPFL